MNRIIYVPKNFKLSWLENRSTNKQRECTCNDDMYYAGSTRMGCIGLECKRCIMYKDTAFNITEQDKLRS